ncbi:MAG: serine hydrolase [Blastocatellia bacterium]|nr:serine hydrolase [Blastocatellia bacterium]
MGAQADRYLAPYLEMKDFSGVVFLARDGKILLSKGYGMSNYEHRVPNTPQTRFHIASISKTFTAAAIAILQKKGLLSFDDKLSKFIPDYPDGDVIKLEHLLTHSAGIPDYWNLPDVGKIKMSHSTLEELVAWLKTKSLDFSPGTRNQYSNSGYTLLAYIIEKASKQTYEEFLREQIFEPLGMKDTGSFFHEPLILNRASGYDPWIGPMGLINAPYYSRSLLVGSGSLYSTAEDLYRWYQAIRNKRLFGLDSLAHPYGWGERKYFGRRLIEQNGRDPGFASCLSAYLEDDLCVIVLSNIESEAVARIKQDMTAMILGEAYETPQIRSPVPVAPKLLDEYEGRYEVSPDFVLTVEREDKHLFLKGGEGPYLPLEPLSDKKFFYKQLYVSIIFERDASGKVTRLLWDGKFLCKKIDLSEDRK